MQTISITAMERPHLFAALLDTLTPNELSGWKIRIGLEPSPVVSEFFEICRHKLAENSYSIEVNNTRLGVRRNPYELLRRTFELSEFNVYLEEDLLLAPDAIDMASWYERNRKDDWVLLNLMGGPCGSAGAISSPHHPTILFESKLFNSIGFALRREEWIAHVEPVWMGEVPNYGENEGNAYWRTMWGWDWSLYAHIASSSLATVQPAFARATHNGPIGVHCTPEIHEAFFGKLKINQTRVEDFVLKRLRDLPHELASHIHALHEMTAMRIALENATLERIAVSRRATAFPVVHGDSPSPDP